jgi:hypothetical protein
MSSVPADPNRMTCRACGQYVHASLVADKLTERAHNCPHGNPCPPATGDECATCVASTAPTLDSP